MINILTVKWGTKYSSRYVNNLFNGFKRFNKVIPLKFHCFTDDPEGLHPDIVVHSLPGHVPSWWNKLYLFSNELPIQGPVFYFDLDTVIVDDISGILATTHNFINNNKNLFYMLQDVYHPEVSSTAA